MLSDGYGRSGGWELNKYFYLFAISVILLIAFYKYFGYTIAFIFLSVKRIVDYFKRKISN